MIEPDLIKLYECEHIWMYDNAVYGNNVTDKCTIRRWCKVCGVNQHAYASEWQESQIGEDCEFEKLPEGYEVDDD